MYATNNVARPDPSTFASGHAWELTRAVHNLRLTIADACLRAQEEALRIEHESAAYWSAMGRAYGYQKAVTILRGWSHPDCAEEIIAQLTRRVMHARRRVQRAAERPNARAFSQNYLWALEWTITQTRELTQAAMPGQA